MARDRWRWSYSGSTLFPIVGSFVVTPVLTRMLSPHEYGSVAVAALTVQVAGLVLALGLSSRIILTVVRQGPAQARGLTLAAVIVGVALGVSAAVLLWPVRAGESWLTACLIALYGAGISAGISNLLSLLRSLRIPKPYVLVSALTSVGAPVIGLASVYFSHGSWWNYLAGLYLGTTLALLVGWRSCRGPVEFHWRNIQNSVLVGLPLLPHQVAIASLPLLIVALASAKESPATAGSLQLGLYLASTVSLAVGALNATWSPAVLGANASDRPNLARSWFRRVSWLVSGLYVLLAWFAPTATRVLASGAYDRDLISRTAILAGMSGVATVFLTGESHFLLARDRTKSLAFVAPLIVLAAFSGMRSWWETSEYLPGCAMTVSFLMISMWIRFANVLNHDSHIPGTEYIGPLVLMLSVGCTCFLANSWIARASVQVASGAVLVALGLMAISQRRRIGGFFNV